ncbi:MAG: hypothetical protein NZM06_09870 [Chloroherpetonaceae bacterium]|nr:hypothetical protein [Chloroherpetonaceae bacterium]MDW8437743.1 hypothetical protein [Chloroherpetonaceae bacterium]
MWSKMRVKASRFVAEKRLSREDMIEALMLFAAVLMFVTANSCQF